MSEQEIVGWKYESDHLDKKTLHLVAMATHLAAGNGYCAKWRVKHAREAGATDAEIKETIGMAVRAGASLIYQEAIDHFPDDLTPPKRN